MVWVRIDDEFTEHPKVVQAGPLAIAMQVAGLCYCNRKQTDGFVPRGIARRLLDWEINAPDGRRYMVGVTSGMSGEDVDCDWVIGLLVHSGMWHEVEGGYYIHDFGDFQPSAEQVERDRQLTAERVKRHRNAQRNADSNGVTNGGETVPPVPVPEPSSKPSAGGDASEGGSGGERRKRRTPSQPLPDDWQPTDKHREKAASLGVDPDAEAEAFRDHHLARDSRYADWDRAFHTWLRNTEKFGANGGKANGKPPPGREHEALDRYDPAVWTAR